MWIRSQNKDILIKSKSFIIDSLALDEEEYLHCIRVCFENKVLKIGKYTSLNKARKVLNEIQEKICVGNGKEFYQMPKDEEVEDDD